jgi:hypothetical protein
MTCQVGLRFRTDASSEEESTQIKDGVAERPEKRKKERKKGKEDKKGLYREREKA